MVDKPFSQVCVWPGTLCSSTQVAEFEAFMLKEFGVRAKYLEEIETNPDLDVRGRKVKDTGGRNDLFFSVHEEDVGKFAVPRLQYGIRWLEDVYYNNQGHLYPARVEDYYSWDKKPSTDEDEDDDE